MQNILLYILLILLMSSTVSIFLINENDYVKIASVASTVLKITVDLDPDDDRELNNYKFVYFYSNEVSLQPLNDSDFNMLIYSAYLERVVEYCQWDSENEYSKGWYENIVDSSDFGHGYKNPQINGIISKSTKSFLSSGLYIIDKNLFQINKKEMFIPSYEQLSNFVSSPMQSYFRYIGNGYFYKEYYPGKSDVLKRSMNNLVNYELPKEELYELFETCEPGDMRVSFRVWSPTTISVFGYREGLLIRPHKFEDVMFGKAVEGNVKKKNLLFDNRMKIMAKAYSIRAFAITFAVLLFVYHRKNSKNVLIMTLIIIFCVFHLPGFCNLFDDTLIYIISIFVGILTGCIYYIVDQ